MFDLDMNDAPSLDVVCGRFVGDANRARVWLIRYRALRAWCARPDMADWPNDGGRTPRDVCEVAARFELNDHCEFDAEGFCSAVNVRQWTRVSRPPGAVPELDRVSNATDAFGDPVAPEERLDRWVAREVDQERQLLVRFPCVATVVAAALYGWLAFLISTV
jgi:hypothetical protein